jgi:hypothetical protein
MSAAKNARRKKFLWMKYCVAQGGYNIIHSELFGSDISVENSLVRALINQTYPILHGASLTSKNVGAFGRDLSE